MILHHSIDSLQLHRPVVTIGSFDGVHLGHLSVIDCLKESAEAIGGESVILTFDPHPREVLYPLEGKPGILTTLDEKADILAAQGVRHLIVLPFTRELGNMEYADFVKQILVDRIGMVGLVVGYDHRFGKGRTGDYTSLQTLSEQYRFFLKKLPVYEADNVNVSSTKIRNALSIGDIRRVNSFLGYSYPLTGTVIHGHHLGTRIGFPTANLQISDPRKLLPAKGVYLVYAKVSDQRYPGMLNIGTRPTVSSEGALSLEVHLFDFHRDIYGQTLTIELFDRLRGEQKFDSIEELTTQLVKDREEARYRLSKRL